MTRNKVPLLATAVLEFGTLEGNNYLSRAREREESV
jgi:hypothetical protein